MIHLLEHSCESGLKFASKKELIQWRYAERVEVNMNARQMAASGMVTLKVGRKT